MLREEKERVVAELEERLRSSETMIVADYRGLSVSQMDKVRTQLLSHGASLTVIKNSLSRRAAEGAGIPELNEFIDGPSAIVFLAEGDVVAVAKTLKDTARETKILSVRGGLLQGQPMSADQVDELASLPPADVLQGQILGAIVGPLTGIVGLLGAPMRELVGVLDARIHQLEEQGDGEPAEPSSEAVSEEKDEQGDDTEPEAAAEAEPEAAAEAGETAGADDAAEAESESPEAKEETENGD